MLAQKITNFKDLEVWKKGHVVVIDIYNITKAYPKEEMYGLANQMRRCAVSITSNIAEGFSRQSYKEKIQFYSVTVGSITELQNQLLISKDVGYITGEIFSKLDNQLTEVHKIANGLIRKSKEILAT